jgi:cytochrome c peroxidase
MGALRSLWVVLLMGIFACQESPTSTCHVENIRYRFPAHFPKVQLPKDNLPNECRILLGRKLFYDTRLSQDQTLSCGSCHNLNMAFTDGQKTSQGFHQHNTQRNAPTLFNLAFAPHYLSEGGVKTLELQALAPLLDSSEMHGNPKGIHPSLLNDPEIQMLSQAAYGRPLDYYVITRALACFERSFISADSPFDHAHYYKDQPWDSATFRGWQLFNSQRLQCSSCHVPPLFTDHQFHNIGLKDNTDLGKERETYLEKDRGKFKTPTLRNIELTPPFMHDGSISTLEDVIRFYDEGGIDHPINKDPRIRPLHLTQQEKNDLLQFLESLTDWNAVQYERFLPLEE